MSESNDGNLALTDALQSAGYDAGPEAAAFRAGWEAAHGRLALELRSLREEPPVWCPHCYAGDCTEKAHRVRR